jgi:hypothetical protein
VTGRAGCSLSAVPQLPGQACPARQAAPALAAPRDSRARVSPPNTHDQDAPPLPLPSIACRRRVVLVRHGQSTWNAEGRIQGSSNHSELTPKGRAQAETTRDMVSRRARVCVFGGGGHAD